ncbi:hypothetical protein Tco_1428993 [Tanacetum coccineum]
MKQVLYEYDRLLDQIISQDIVNIVVNSSVDINDSVNVNVNSMEMCDKCLELEVELIKQHSMVEKDEYNKLSKSYSKLEQRCISLELAMQLNKENFQTNNTSVNQTVPTFDQVLELNNLEAELQAKDTTIKKLKENIKRLNKTSTTNSVKKDIDEFKTINIELEHRVAKLIAKNIGWNRLINNFITQLNQHVKSFVVITTLKNYLRKLKGKDIVDNAAQVSNATTIAPGMYKLDPVTLAPKDKNNRETYLYYPKHTMEQADILKEIVEQDNSLNPLDSVSYSACKYVKMIQELLGYVRDTCPDILKPSEKLVAVTPINKKKTVRITATNEVPLRVSIPLEVVAQEHVLTKVYTRRPKVPKTIDSNSKPKIAKSMTSNKMKPGTSRGSNTLVASTSSSLVNDSNVKFGNDQIAKIMGYGDYHIGNVTILRVYYVEGLGNNLFSVGQFCDSDLKVAFRKHTCFVRNLEGVDLLLGSWETNLYTFSIRDMMVSSPIFLLSKASKTKSWLWH